jgi:hypothetical protein
VGSACALARLTPASSVAPASKIAPNFFIAISFVRCFMRLLPEYALLNQTELREDAGRHDPACLNGTNLMSFPKITLVILLRCCSLCRLSRLTTIFNKEVCRPGTTLARIDWPPKCERQAFCAFLAS